MMNILILGPRNRNARICSELDLRGYKNLQVEELDGIAENDLLSFTHLVSSGYHRRINRSVLDLFEPRRRLNIHASYLPFGKGIGTILFAVLYPVTLGSSIHILDYDIDLGDILIQKKFVLTDTLISQRKLHHLWVSHASGLFIENVEPLLEGEFSHEKQSATFSSPYLSRDESELHLSLLSKGWDSSIEEIQYASLALSLRLASLTLYPND